MTHEQKAWIDYASYEELLRKYRFAAIGDPLFSGACGDYYVQVMRKKREEVGDAAHVRASKFIGWEE
jgi:hypothetical protein